MSSLVLEDIRPEVQHQIEEVAAQVGVAPGDVARRMIEAAFGNGNADIEFLHLFKQFSEADSVQRKNMAPILRNLIVQASAAGQIYAGSAQITGVLLPVQAGTESFSPGSAKPFHASATSEEWNAAFLEWTESHQGLPRLPAEAFTRDADYEDYD